MQQDLDLFVQRKQDHIQLALDPAHQTSELNAFDAYELMHEAIPNLNFSDIDLSTPSLGYMRATPFFVSSMTAGHQHAQIINEHLLAACQETAWVMGVGSQRRELMDAEAALEWRALKKNYPNVAMMANIGLAQLITHPIDKLKKLIDPIEACALIVHCNPMQELIQPEGDTDFQGSWQALEHLVAHISLPIIVKETGCGFSKNTLQRLNQIGVHAIDVAGRGGTHWGRIEGARAQNYPMRQRAAQTFANWGISTADVLLSAKDILLQAELWGSGGVRHGLDAAKALVMGASQIGIARALLAPALESPEAVIDVMRCYEYELKVAMFCTDSANIADLKQRPLQRK